MRAAGSATPSSYPAWEASDWMANLQLEEKPERAKWSLGVGRLPELEKTPRGVTTTRPRGGEAAWLQEQKEHLLLSQALQLLREVEESRKARKKYACPAGREDKHPRGGTEAAACVEERAQAGEETAQTSGAQAAAAAQGPPAGQAPPQRRRKPKIPLLSERYGGDPKKLGLFLIRVWSHMQEWGEDFLSDAARVRCVTRALEGVAAEWMVGLHNENSPLLRNYDQFVAALRKRFEDPLAERRARIRMRGIHQGRRSVAEYTQEFRELAPYMRGWSEMSLLESYKDGLNDDVYKECCSRGNPRDLQRWYVLAADVEIDLAEDRSRGGRTWNQPPPTFHKRAPKAAKGTAGSKPKSSACSKCGKEGHRAAECFSKPGPKATPTGGKRADKAPARARETAHHPQTHGASLTNSVVEQYLRCYINYHQDNWADLLPFAEVAYNNSIHSSTGFTPFKVASGQDFVPIPELPQENPQIPSLADKKRLHSWDYKE